MPSYKTAEARILGFKARINKASGQGPRGTCWEWTASLSTGYGQFIPGLLLCGEKASHRIAFKLANPNIDIKGWEICHKCDNKACVRLAHLFRGSHEDNMHDMSRKGRAKGGAIVPRKGSKNPSAVLNEKQVKQILIMLDAGVFQRIIGSKFGVGQGVK